MHQVGAVFIRGVFPGDYQDAAHQSLSFCP
jgi:hypothetical protein